MVSASKIPEYLEFSFSPSILMYYWFGFFYSVHWFSFPTFHNQHGIFFNAKFHFYILVTQSADATECTDCIFAEEWDSPNECPRYDTKRSDGEVPVMQELWETQSTSSMPSLPGLLWLGVVATDRVLSTAQIEQNPVLMINWHFWNRTVYMYRNWFGIK